MGIDFTAMSILRTGMFTAVAISTSLLVAVPANADPGTDFLTMVSAAGLNVGDTPADVEITLSTGDEICNVLHDGYSPQEAARQVHYRFPNATPQQAAGFVDAAQAKLCGPLFAPMQPW
jgi:hypothetical protein